MASTIGKVRAVFTASSSGLTAGVNQASASMKRLERDVRGLRGGLSALTAISGAQLFGSIASTAASYARSLAQVGLAATEAISSQRDLAARLGLTYGELSGLSLAGNLVGVSMEQIGGAVTKAEVAFSKAAAGSKTARDAFASIGLSVEQLNGMSAAERFDAIAQAISQIPNEAERSAAAVRLFGRSGAMLLPMFEEGAAGIARARQEAERFGLSLTNAQANNVDAMGDSFDRAKMAIQGVINQIVANLAPAVTSITEAFSNLIAGVGGKDIGAAIGEGILQAATYFAGVADWFVSNVPQVWDSGSAAASSWSSVWDIGGRTAQLFVSAGEALRAAFGIVIVSLGGIVEGLVNMFASGADFFGFDVSGIDQAKESLAAFNKNISGQIVDDLNGAAESFGRVWADAPADELGEAAAGPIRKTLDQAIAAQRAAANAVDTAKKQTVDVKQTVEIRGITEAIKAVDSRSTEGMREYFRMMRGDNTKSIQERIAVSNERIADNTEDLDFDLDVLELAPAAGS